MNLGQTTDDGATQYVWDASASSAQAPRKLLAELDEALATLAQYTDFPGVRGGSSSVHNGNGSGGASGFLAPDLSGNVRQLLNATQGIQEASLYSAFGEPLAGATASPLGFGGGLGYYEDALDRLYVRARHYQPAYGRWTSRDPLGGFMGGYEYVGNRAVGLVDPSGWQGESGELDSYVRGVRSVAGTVSDHDTVPSLALDAGSAGLSGGAVSARHGGNMAAATAAAARSAAAEARELDAQRAAAAAAAAAKARARSGTFGNSAARRHQRLFRNQAIRDFERSEVLADWAAYEREALAGVSDVAKAARYARIGRVIGRISTALGCIGLFIAWLDWIDGQQKTLRCLAKQPSQCCTPRICEYPRWFAACEFWSAAVGLVTGFDFKMKSPRVGAGLNAIMAEFGIAAMATNFACTAGLALASKGFSDCYK